MNHKRLEVLKKEDGKWQRTGNIPTCNLECRNLEIEEGYKVYSFYSSIDNDLEKMIEQLGDDQEKIEQVTQNAKKSITLTNKVLKSAFSYYPSSPCLSIIQSAMNLEYVCNRKGKT